MLRKNIIYSIIIGLFCSGLLFLSECYGLSANQVLVIYNADNTTSTTIAEYYKTARGLSDNQLLGLTGLGGTTLTHDQYQTQIMTPVISKINSMRHYNIQCLVTVTGIPTNVREGSEPTDFSSTWATVDSELTVLGSVGSEGPLVNPYSFYEWDDENSEFVEKSTPPGAFDKRQYGGMYLVCRLENTLMIDQAILAEQNGIYGKAFFDARRSTDDYETDTLIRKAYNYVLSLGIEAHLEESSGFYRNPPYEYVEDAFFYWGWYGNIKYDVQPDVEGTDNDYGDDVYNFVPGAIAATVLSWRGYFVDGLIPDGISGTQYPTAEPFTTAYSDPYVLIKYYLAGYSYAEAVYVSQRLLSWQMIIVGDPLMKVTYNMPSFSVTISGDTSVTENSSAQYTASVDYGTGTTSDVTQSVTWSVIPSDYASISASGLLSVSALTKDYPVYIRAEYNDGSETHFADFSVKIDNIFHITSMEPVPNSELTESPKVIVITCSEAISASSVNTSQCQLIGAGDDESFGTDDDITIPVSTYLEDSYTIHLDLGNYILPTNSYQISLTNIVNTANAKLDGSFSGVFPSGDGTSDGNFTAYFSINRQLLSFVCNDNDTVSLAWMSFRDDTSYIIEYTDSYDTLNWTRVEPEGQWPIETTAWTGDALSGINHRVYRVVAGLSFIKSLSPDEGVQGASSLVIEVVGYDTAWTSSDTTVDFGDGITVNTVTVSDETHLSVEISIDGSADPGYRDITITTGSNIETKANGFTLTEL